MHALCMKVFSEVLLFRWWNFSVLLKAFASCPVSGCKTEEIRIEKMYILCYLQSHTFIQFRHEIWHCKAFIVIACSGLIPAKVSVARREVSARGDVSGVRPQSDHKPPPRRALGPRWQPAAVTHPEQVPRWHSTVASRLSGARECALPCLAVKMEKQTLKKRKEMWRESGIKFPPVPQYD